MSNISIIENKILTSFNIKKEQTKFYKKVGDHYSCLYHSCNKNFNTELKIKKHVRSHIFKKKIMCKFKDCGKLFSSLNNLKIHFRWHTGEKPYKCPEKSCEKRFYDLGNLKYHNKIIHLQLGKRYVLECYHKDCLLSFKTLKQRSLHHEKTENECNNESLLLINLLKKFQGTLTSLENSILKLVNEEKVPKQTKSNEYLYKIKSDYEELNETLEKRGKESYCNLMKDFIDLVKP